LLGLSQTGTPALFPNLLPASDTISGRVNPNTCTKSHVYRRTLHSEIRTTVKTEKDPISYLLDKNVKPFILRDKNNCNTSFGRGSANTKYGFRFGFYANGFAAFEFFLYHRYGTFFDLNTVLPFLKN
jgi:hypothetical protein